jgi:serine/threonine protein kinase
METGQHPAATGIAHIQGPAIPAVERYGRYYLIERIGRGGMAEVFRAVAKGVEGFRRVFVIKRLRPEKVDSPDLVRMFCDEARLSALLHHPNVVQVYDFGQIGGTHFLAMEYLRGKDLSAVMKASRAARAAVSPSIAAHVAQQVAIGLHYAHTLSRMDGRPLGIVHRDVTPSNIMIQRTGGVKILDFGIAQATNFARQTETGGGRVKGKLAYLSPEQVRLEPLDGRSDVFALGVVLWEMLTGQRLFSAESEFLTMRNVLTQPIPPPSSIRPQVTAALDGVVARALKRDRERRYADAREMADDLEKALREIPCPTQALSYLLQDLFGHESAELTPDLPDPSSGVERHVRRIGPHPLLTPSSIDIAADELPADSATTLAAIGDAQSQPLPDRRPALRGLIAALSAATLIACFAWALWQSRGPDVVAWPQSAPAQVAAPIVVPMATPAPVALAEAAAPAPEPTPAARGEAAAPATLSSRVALARKSRAGAAHTRTHAAKKRVTHARHLSRNATIDPFR